MEGLGWVWYEGNRLKVGREAPPPTAATVKIAGSSNEATYTVRGHLQGKKGGSVFVVSSHNRSDACICGGCCCGRRAVVKRAFRKKGGEKQKMARATRTCKHIGLAQ